MTDLRETVAYALWKQDAERAAPNVAKHRTLEAFRNTTSDGDREVWLQRADAAIAARDVAVANNRLEKLKEEARERAKTKFYPPNEEVFDPTTSLLSHEIPGWVMNIANRGEAQKYRYRTERTGDPSNYTCTYTVSDGTDRHTLSRTTNFDDFLRELMERYGPNGERIVDDWAS